VFKRKKGAGGEKRVAKTKRLVLHNRLEEQWIIAASQTREEQQKHTLGLKKGDNEGEE